MKMKKIVVMSDSHGYHQMINRVKELEPDGDYYVHCGDSEAETYMMQDWLCVKGKMIGIVIFQIKSNLKLKI